jgi:integrase/recombinase XerD
MFETLFTYPAVLARHQTGPGSAERVRYLAHCAGGEKSCRSVSAAAL